jgi:hypothetical protein
MVKHIDVKYLSQTERGKIMVRTGQKYVGVFDDVSKAKKALAKHLGVPVHDLPKASADKMRKDKMLKMPAVRTHKAVFPTGGAFEVRTSEGYQGTYKTMASAVQAAAGHFGVDPDELRLDRASVEKIADAKRRFIALSKAFEDIL